MAALDGAAISFCDSSSHRGKENEKVLYRVPPGAPQPDAVNHTPIRATLSGDDIATAFDISAQSSGPVLALCRQLVAAGHDPAMPLHAYRGDTLALIIRSIGEAANLEINGKGTGFVTRHAVGTGSPIAPNAPAGTRDRAKREAA
jgi:hypothetical protein